MNHGANLAQLPDTALPMVIPVDFPPSRVVVYLLDFPLAWLALAGRSRRPKHPCDGSGESWLGNASLAVCQGSRYRAWRSRAFPREGELRANLARYVPLPPKKVKGPGRQCYVLIRSMLRVCRWRDASRTKRSGNLSLIKLQTRHLTRCPGPGQTPFSHTWL